MPANGKERRWPMELALSVLRISVAAYIGTCLVVFLMQSRYVYYPQPDVALTPAYLRLSYEEVVLRTEDGETVNAWFVPAGGSGGVAEAACPTVLFFHGNACNRGGSLDWIRAFHALGMNVLAAEYRGYGGSSGRPTEKGTYRDAQAAWEYLVKTRGIPRERIVVYGWSLGGAVAAWLGEQVRPGVLAIESCFTSAPDMAARMFWFLPGRWLCRFRYDTLGHARKAGCPVWLAHSEEDSMMPFVFGQRIFEAAAEPKEFVRMRGDHNDGGMTVDPEAQRRFREFVRRHAGAGAEPAGGGKAATPPEGGPVRP